MKKVFIPLAAALLLTLPSCRFIRISDELKQTFQENAAARVDGDGVGALIEAGKQIVSQTHTPGNFDIIRCNLPCDINYTPGDCSLTISGPENILEHILVSVDNGELIVKSDGSRFRNVKDLRIRLNCPELRAAVLNGAANFRAPEGITAPDFHATVNGAGDIVIDGLKAEEAGITVNGAGDATVSGIACSSITVSINGAGDATVSGQADAADLSVSGAGDIHAEGLEARQFNSKILGAGKIHRSPKD